MIDEHLGAEKPSRLRRFLNAYIQPIVFIIGFPLAFASALHAPAPHDVPVLIVGPNAVVSEIATGLDGTGAIAATHTDDVSAAQEDVKNRDVLGSVQIDVAQVSDSDQAAAPTFTVTTYVASGGSPAAASVVSTTGEQVAEQLGTSSKVVDLAPLADGDGLGTGLFYLVTYTSLGGYLVIVSLMQFLPGARLRTRYVAAAAAGIGAPLLVFGLSSFFLSAYGQSFATIAAALAVTGLYVFTVALAAILLQQLFGKAVTAAIMVVIVFINFPSTGGALPGSMLPPFWAGVHNVYFGSGALESIRSIVYFEGNGVSRWLLQLVAWTVFLLLLTMVVELVKTVRRQRTALATPPVSHVEGHHCASGDRDSESTSAPRELMTAGEPR